MVVIRGPEATAGSKPIFLKTIGVIRPTKEEMLTEKNIETERINETSQSAWCFLIAKKTSATAKVRSASAALFIRLILSSREILVLTSRLSSSSPREIPLIVTPRVWVLTFPTMSNMRDWKKTRIVA